MCLDFADSTCASTCIRIPTLHVTRLVYASSHILVPLLAFICTLPQLVCRIDLYSYAVAIHRSRSLVYIAVSCISCLVLVMCIQVACLWVLIGCGLLVVALGLVGCCIGHSTLTLSRLAWLLACVVFIAVFLDMRNMLELFMDSKARTCVDSWLAWLL